MKLRRTTSGQLSLVVLIGFLIMPPLIDLAKRAEAKEAIQEWELIDPKGVVKVDPIKINPHPSTLEGKTVVLRWNGKPNGDNFLNRVAGLLTEQVKNIKIIKMWELDSSTAVRSPSQEVSKEIASKIAKLKPDLVIGCQAD